MGNVKIVSASAGSGKTYTLAYEYVRNVIADPSLYRHMLAVTFTNKATEEMKRRILAKINELARGEEREYLSKLQKDLKLSTKEITLKAETVRSLILHDYNHFSVVTIDKFFQRIIRAFIKELGIDLNFNLELPIETLLGSAADRMIDDISTDEVLRKWIIAFVHDKIDDGRPWDIRHELLELGSELFKEDYKRSHGKSAHNKEQLRKIVDDAIRKGTEAKEAIISCGRKIAEVASSNNLEITDFCYGKMGPMGYAAKTAAGTLSPYGKRVKDTLESGRWCTAKSPKKAEIEAVSSALTQLLGELAKAYDKNIGTINTAALIKENYRNFALLGDLQNRVTEVAKEENIVHISEINEMLSKLIAGNDTPFVFEKAGNYFSHFLIDEFQDTSVLQWENFLPLLRNAVSQSDETPVMLVGDVKQSIYRWRGGDWGILANRAEKAFDTVTKTSLRENFRSRAEIVNFINAAVGKCAEKENCKINAMLEEACEKGQIDEALRNSLYGAVAQAYSDCSQLPDPNNVGGYVTVTYYGETDRNAIPPVIETVETLQERGYKAGDIAILVRRNSEATQIATMLLDYKRTHPDSPYRYDVVTQDALVTGKSPVINFVTACLYLSCNVEDCIHRALYNHFLGRDFAETVPEDEVEFFGRLCLMPPEEAFESIVIRYGLGEAGHDIPYLQALHEQIISFTKTNVADIPLFLRWWSETGSGKSIPMPEGGEAITIDTIHRSKGLGYKAVIIPYCNWSLTAKPNSVVWASSANETTERLGSFPVHYKKSMENSLFASDYYREYVMSQIDNLNLFYVALTRAKEELHIMFPAPGRTESERVNSLLDSVMVRSEDRIKIGEVTGLMDKRDDGFSISFGVPSGPSQTKENMDRAMPKYTTMDVEGRIAVKLGSQRYIDEGVTDDKFSPRNYGVLMHKLFEQADDLQRVRSKITELNHNGMLSSNETDQLAAGLDSALENPLVREWFGNGWETVRHENAIIVPGGEGYRPDRVMTKGREAVVIDYKFGKRRIPSYRQQVNHYMSLLSQMGYSPVRGYIWYVGLGEIDEVGQISSAVSS